MPWILKVEREELKEKFKTMKVLTKGQATYLFYKRFLELWNREQKYSMIHFVGLLRERTERDDTTHKLSLDLLFKGLTKSEITQCRYDAHHQMERLYFDRYEDKKREENGEVEL